MKKFKFKLKALLAYREHSERMAKEDVAKVQMEINKCLKSIHDCENMQRVNALEFEKKMQEGMTAEEHGRFSEYLGSLDVRIAAETDLLEKLNIILRNKQVELEKKSVSRKILENLKDKKKMEYYEELDRLAMKDADEIVLISRGCKEKQIKE